MDIRTLWVYNDLVKDTVLDFCRHALPDSVIASLPADSNICYPLPYELADAVPDAFGSQAFYVHVPIEMVDIHTHDAQIDFVLESPAVGEAYVHDLTAERQSFDDPSTTLSWSHSEGMWV